MELIELNEKALPQAPRLSPKLENFMLLLLQAPAGKCSSPPTPIWPASSRELGSDWIRPFWDIAFGWTQLNFDLAFDGECMGSADLQVLSADSRLYVSFKSSAVC